MPRTSEAQAGGWGAEDSGGCAGPGGSGQGEPREAQVGWFQQSPPLPLPWEQRQSPEPHVGAGRRGKRGPGPPRRRHVCGTQELLLPTEKQVREKRLSFPAG